MVFGCASREELLSRLKRRTVLETIASLHDACISSFGVNWMRSRSQLTRVFIVCMSSLPKRRCDKTFESATRYLRLLATPRQSHAALAYSRHTYDCYSHGALCVSMLHPTVTALLFVGMRFVAQLRDMQTSRNFFLCA